MLSGLCYFCCSTFSKSWDHFSSILLAPDGVFLFLIFWVDLKNRVSLRNRVFYWSVVILSPRWGFFISHFLGRWIYPQMQKFLAWVRKQDPQKRVRVRSWDGNQTILEEWGNGWRCYAVHLWCETFLSKFRDKTRNVNREIGLNQLNLFELWKCDLKGRSTPESMVRSTKPQ
jgi:hypothetical protein